MKVALLNGQWYPNTGGGIVHVDALATHLAEDYDCTVDVVVKESEVSEEFADSPDNVNIVQIPIIEFGSRFLTEIQYIMLIIVHIYNQNYDIVHAHTNVTVFPLQILRFFNDSPTVLTVHGASLDFAVTYTDSLLDLMYTHIRHVILEQFNYDGVISVSNELASALAEHHDTVEFIPNGVAVDEFPSPSSESSCCELLFVGRLRPKKNPVDAVEAMETVVEKYPEAVLHIVGTGPLEEEIKQETAARGIDKAVTIHGRVSDERLYKLYQKCSIFVLPSKWEGHPLVLLEAWASGMVVIGTDVEGIREFLGNNHYGRLVPLNEPDQLASAIVSVLNRPAALKRNGRHAREYVRENYDWGATASLTYNFYRQLIENMNQSQTEIEEVRH